MPLTATQRRQRAQLRRAAAAVDKRGFCRWHLMDKKGRVCIRGAMYLACGVNPKTDPGKTMNAKDLMVIRAIDRKVTITLGGLNPAAWNNTVARSKRDLIRVLLDTAKRIGAKPVMKKAAR